jgi:hypothetical protein
MQLTRKNSIADALAIATCSLLAQTSQNAYAIDEDVDLDLSFLEYHENSRVRVREMDVDAKWIYDEDNVFSGKLVTDAITGSTPSGALTPVLKTATLTSPSGVSGASGSGGSGSGLTIRPLEGFVDRRVALGANWERTYNRTYRTNLGANFSNEDDYQSYGGSATFAYDLNQKLTTLEAGIGYSYDFVGSVVGVHKELGNLADDIPGDYNDGEKQVIDWGLSATQILTRRSVVKVGYSSGSVQGYLSDPYKVITLKDKVDPNKFTYFHEKRPTSRSRSSLNFDFNQEREDNGVVNVYYRYYWDSWGISSHTVDARFRHELGNTRYIQPHVRVYRQSAADFFYPFLDEAKGQDPDNGSSPPTYASADNRLDAMVSYTVGVKYGLSGSLGKFFARFEMMRQIGSKGDYRNLTAEILQFVWTLDFKK